MKQLLNGLLIGGAGLGWLWYMFGGPIFTAIMATLILVSLLLIAFGLGSWWSGKLMERGAKIALQAQSSDDRRDTVQVHALAGLVKETLKIRHSLTNRPHYPSLPFGEPPAPFGESPARPDFIIAGLEEEETNEQ